MMPTLRALVEMVNEVIGPRYRFVVDEDDSEILMVLALVVGPKKIERVVRLKKRSDSVVACYCDHQDEKFTISAFGSGPIAEFAQFVIADLP